MARIPPHIVDLIIDTARIEDVISDFVVLKKAGSNLKGLSPFTEEKTPSFIVSPAKQIFKCFSSSKGGGVVSFLMEHEHFSYPEALKWLAEKYQIEIPEDKPLTEEEQNAISERENLHIINEFARDFFYSQLHGKGEGEIIGKAYFVERGFTTETIEKFKLGYCPSKEKSFTATALEKGFKLDYLEKLGLTRTNDNRNFDFFSGRVIFPIHSVSGKVLGFGGRILQNNLKTAKYFNSPENLIYNKSKILYGLFHAKSSIIKNDNCYLVEGYTDVISLHQAGIENVVASSGTALTKDQIKLIKRYSSNITILYDGDAAGIRASFRGVDLILEEGMNVKVVLFPEGEDPDSYARKNSFESFSDYIRKNQQDFVSFKSNILLKEAANDPIKKANLIKEILSSISLIPDQIFRMIYLKEVASRFEMNEQTLSNEINKLRSGHSAASPIVVKNKDHQTTQKPSVTVIKSKGNYAKEFDLIRILVLYGKFDIPITNDVKKQSVPLAEIVINELEKDQLFFQDEQFQKIFNTCKEGLVNNIIYDPKFFLKNEDQNIVKLVADFNSSKHELSTNWLTKFKIGTLTESQKLYQTLYESLYAFKIMKLDEQLLAIREMTNPNHEGYDESKNDQHLLEIVKLTKIRTVLANELSRIIV